MLYILRCFYVGYINIYKHCILLGWSFYYYIVTTLSLTTAFVLKIYFVWYKYSYSSFFLFPLAWVCFQPFTLRCVSLHLKSPVGSIYSATLHRLIGKLSPFSLKVIDRYVIIANFFLFGSSSLRDFYIVVCLDSFIFCISTVDFCFVVTIRNKGFFFFLN